ncbi:unnamed protein product [Effrenium voratum]|uniref:Uncharacterized protein n=1 Tax=Effrenium voratum TaxID=2562239 RepID=A0AA36MM63_9DINO|nr:unnamed protein product [Effrenium voratum]
MPGAGDLGHLWPSASGRRPSWLELPQELWLAKPRRASAAFSFLDAPATVRHPASFGHKEELDKKAGQAATGALDYAYNAEIQSVKADYKADLAEDEVEEAESWEDYELSLLAFLSLVMVGTTGWLYNQYQRWLGMKKTMAEQYHNRTSQ